MKHLAIVGGASSVLVGGLAALHAPWPWLVLAHGLGALGVGIAGRRARPSEPMAAWRAATLALCFPVAGPLLVAACWPPHDAGPRGFELTLEHPLRPDPALEPLDARALLERELGVQSYLDQLRFGSVAAKRAAAEAIAGFDGAEGIAALRAVLTDPDADARLFASLALLQKEERFAAQLKAAREAYQQQAASSAAALQLAAIARRYAESSLVVGGVLAECWQSVEQAAGRVLALPAAPEARLEAHLHLSAARRALGDVAGAIEAAERATEAAARAERAWLALGEALFAAGALDRLRALAERLWRLAAPHSAAHLVAGYWRTHGR